MNNAKHSQITSRSLTQEITPIPLRWQGFKEWGQYTKIIVLHIDFYGSFNYYYS